MAKFLKNNGLTIALVVLFAGSMVGHWLAGWHFQNEQLLRHGKPAISAMAFMGDPQFTSTVFENWESEFLQMSAYVILTGFLFQRGSAESSDPDARERDGERTPAADTPAAMHRGAFARWAYSHSLGLILLSLFVASFALHWLFSAREAADEAVTHGDAPLSAGEYLTSAQLWFESFQNWQSEFLSTAVIVVLSIFLREKGSPESKPVAAPHDQTGT